MPGKRDDRRYGSSWFDRGIQGLSVTSGTGDDWD
jgi:hypothetical protein